MTSSTPVIMLTGWGTMLQDNGETVPNVDAVLSKPPRVEELVEAVSKVTGVAAPRMSQLSLDLTF